MSGAGAAAGAAAARAIANATKASGAIIQLDPNEFYKILNRNMDGILVQAVGGIFSTHYKYITQYKGLFFYCKTSDALEIPGTVEVINARSIWIPD